MTRDRATSFDSLRNRLASVVAVAVALVSAPNANAVTLYWDADSTLEGAGTWDNNTTQNWNTANAAGAPNSKWTPNDGTVDATFGGTLSAAPQDGTGSANGQVSVSGTINVDSITFAPTAGTYALSGGTLNITNPTSSILMNTNTTGSNRAQIISSVISGTTITAVAGNGGAPPNALLTLGAPGTGVTNTFTGDLVFGGPSNASVGLFEININNPTALPSTATVRMQRNNCQLIFGAGGASGSTPFSATFNNNIVLNDNGSGTSLQSSIGVLAGAVDVTQPRSVITLGGVISGNAALTFQLGNGGGNGTIVLTNHSTYTGSTNLNSNTGAVLQLGTNNALPTGTTFSVTKGRFNMAGFNQQVGGIAGSGGNGFITNTSGSTSTLTISGSVVGDYAGLIGVSSISGSNDNIALNLASTNTGSLTLSNASGNTYNGGTTISGGKLYANNNANNTGSATGTGPVAVNSGGTLGGTGSVGGAVTVASGGHLTAGARTGANTIGTLIGFNSVTLNSGANLDIDLGAPAPTGGASDQISLNPFFGSFPLTVPAAASSIGVNLSDPAGGAAGNGTYTLLTFSAGQYTGSSNASQFFTNSLPTPNSLNGATIAYHLADDTNTVQDGNPSSATRVIMVVSGGPNALLWTGGAGNGNWDVASTSNFKNLGTNSATTFANNDNVTFNDTGTNTNPITVAAGGVQPNIITINNSTTTYSFTGGDIKGSSVGGVGGMILSGSGNVTIGNNYTAAGPITSSKTGTGSVTFNGAITAATSLTVNSGTVTLGGANTFTGNDTVNGGTLAVQGANATFGAGNVTVSAGSASIAAGVTNAIANTATLTLAGGGAANTADVGYISLAAGINEQVASLVLGATTYTSGTFGATGSGATNIFDEYFSGTGIITVVGGIPGDYNGDGKVDGADYVLWRKSPGSFGGTPAGYNTWRAHYGATSGSGAGLSSQSAAVPEPTSLLLAVLPLAGMIFGRRRARI